jgi:7-cyano-7-deazaguanine synthase in queuosine biosynthesis
MIRPRLILCGGLEVAKDDPLREGRHMVELCTHGTKANVNVRLEDLAKVFDQHLSPRLEDLLEIAAYVYTADCATRRAGNWADDDTTEPWNRDFHFVIPVRDLTFWTRDEVRRLLVEILRFLSDDNFIFTFRQLTEEPAKQLYLEFGELEDWPFYGAPRVLMFSGGLDSLAGALETAASGENLVLVSHRPVSTQSSRQTNLFNALRQRFASPMIHVPVWVNKDENKGREPTQRTRSFLYASLGSIVAASVNAAGVRFFENGVVSLNLPVADEVTRARASRTTHPIALDQFRRFFSTVLERDVVVDNPFLFKTKAEVVSLIGTHSGAELIGLTCSCSHPMFQSKTRWHCGTCSQCIDRRMAVIAAEVDQHDADHDYEIDVFRGPRKDGYEKNMAVDYVRHALELNRMTPEELAARFNRDLGRAVRFFSKRSEAAQQFIEMHQRHSEIVETVVVRQLQNNAGDLVAGKLAPSSLLALVAGQQHQIPIWQRYANRITELLQGGLPTACKSHKPTNEPHLQEICDGILNGHDGSLVREFPFVRWGSSLTKPDWSAEELRLWVELKYVRKKEDVRQIGAAIAEDITKYGDSVRNVLYVVYDPDHLITDERSFAEPILKRPTMQIRFIR